ncbi:MAG: recombinase family protein [Beduini sp.]|uniref:recombinase family protein n=1 Tax=Beduini sp. TaxID=1922300 RepID=UPI003990D66D
MRQLYADEAKTGTSTVNRDAFNEMMRDAMDGKFDMLITKSITRFARNTLDMYYQM